MQPLHPEPIFILGHPRTGTTHIHNLLSIDDEFAFATTFCAGFPSSFLCIEKWKGLLAGLLSETRPMDKMKLSWDLPAEDEIATTLLSGGISPYTAIVLPREECSQFRPFFSFSCREALSPTTSSDLDLIDRFKSWQGSFLYFIKKVTLRHSLMHQKPAHQPAPLLIKSPVHTARIPLLLKMFPKARFVFIHRDPYEVFQSAANMAEKYYGHCYLQKPEDKHLDTFIIEQYKILNSEYLKGRKMVEADRLFELGFSDLEADPLKMIEEIYKRFGWSERFDSLRAKFEAYILTLSDFKRNDFVSMSPEMKDKVKKEWGDISNAFGYQL